MTRINVVPVKELCDKHLLAEYRELPRVFALARPCHDAPNEYTLGKGHVKFFYDKLHYLTMRFYDLIDEMWLRGFKPSYEKPPVIEDLSLYGTYRPTPEAISINRARIADRISKFKKPIKLK